MVNYFYDNHLENLISFRLYMDRPILVQPLKGLRLFQSSVSLKTTVNSMAREIQSLLIPGTSSEVGSTFWNLQLFFWVQ